MLKWRPKSISLQKSSEIIWRNSAPLLILHSNDVGTFSLHKQLMKNDKMIVI